jgi:hypothetical protein
MLQSEKHRTVISNVNVVGYGACSFQIVCATFRIHDASVCWFLAEKNGL